MKTTNLLLFLLLINTQTLFAQLNASFCQELKGKKIKTAIIRNTGPVSNNAPKTVNIGSTTITSGNAASATNSMWKELAFNNITGGVELERKFTRISTRTVNPYGERVVDTDNPFERPDAMAKIGEKYDNLIKQKMVTRMNNTQPVPTGDNAMFQSSWNEFVPYFSLDSILNIVHLALPSKSVVGSTWTDSASNGAVNLRIGFTVQQKTGDTLIIEYSGVNIYTPPENKSGNIVANLFKLQSVFEGMQKVDAKTGFIYNIKITGITRNRKLAMGQEFDNEIKEDIVVTNTIVPLQ
jgi:hypothetical protein